MRADPPLLITGVGAVTPGGLSAPATCATLRAGIARMKEIETTLVDGEQLATVPPIGGRAPTEWFTGGPVEWEWPGHERFGSRPPSEPEKLVAPGVERLCELAKPAAREAWRDDSDPPPGRTGLYLGLPEGEAPAAVLVAVREAVGVAFARERPVLAGRAAGLLALAEAVEDLREGRVDSALVGGVDSLIRAPSIRALQLEGLLKTANRPGGVIPGEGAAFVRLEREDHAARRGASGPCRILAVGTEEEPTFGTDDPNIAVGLTRALREAVNDGGGLEAPPLVLCDLTGDRNRAMEWGLAFVRVLGSLHGDGDLWHAADCFGDPGACSGPLNLIWAATAFLKGYAHFPRVLVWGASDGVSRAAALLSGPEE